MSRLRLTELTGIVADERLAKVSLAVHDPRAEGHQKHSKVNAGCRHPAGPLTSAPEFIDSDPSAQAHGHRQGVEAVVTAQPHDEGGQRRGPAARRTSHE